MAEVEMDGENPRNPAELLAQLYTLSLLPLCANLKAPEHGGPERVS